ncbi:hypothetical protein [Sphingomicrobium sediminis]|uniref:Uncharacterized protein n=1 Tax=Sphingomicrobium sediminis TaxID=2950949 RepID=A0A9X2EI90_9SPHN|nr:hypothetical protein [Sphingomicrobium sediminis]MCM8557991.1 hypothetical protein [Sphingomicrobium sediminis]
MDLNELLHRQQVALMKADLADDCSSREAHLAEVADYAGSIADLRQAKAAPPYPAPSGNARLDEWVDDGGATQSLSGMVNVPPLVTKTIIEYHVGTNRYTDLAHAMAERARLAVQAP